MSMLSLRLRSRWALRRPADLGLRLGLAGGDVDIERAVASVAAAAKKHGKAWGIPAGTPELLAKYRAQGAQMLAYGDDLPSLRFWPIAAGISTKFSVNKTMMNCPLDAFGRIEYAICWG